jgi:uncharacterized protein YgfB (UPF0149 family)
MPAEAWVVVGGMILAGVAGTIWWARHYDRTVASYQNQVGAALAVHSQSRRLFHRQEDVLRRSLALLDRQGELVRRAESLMERLDKH